MASASLPGSDQTYSATKCSIHAFILSHTRPNIGRLTFEMSPDRRLSKRLTTGYSQTLETEQDYGAIHSYGTQAGQGKSVVRKLPARLRVEYYGRRQSMISI
jgi:phage gpG-like protein